MLTTNGWRGSRIRSLHGCGTDLELTEMRMRCSECFRNSMRSSFAPRSVLVNNVTCALTFVDSRSNSRVSNTTHRFGQRRHQTFARQGGSLFLPYVTLLFHGVAVQNSISVLGSIPYVSNA